ncbi:hypothetical protein Bca101_089300 [Brassica carinata]
MAVHTNLDDDNKPISTRPDVSLEAGVFLKTDEADVLLKTDEADVSLKTDETDITFEMMIIELRSDLIPRREYLGSSIPSSVTILLNPDISMIFDLRI